MTHNVKIMNGKLIRNLEIYRIHELWFRVSMNSIDFGQYVEMYGISYGLFLSVAQTT
jgi:hypothetical protein